ncbi:unnamed protein product [Lampetra planeri]
MEFGAVVAEAEVWCLSTPFSLFASEQADRRLHFLSEPVGDARAPLSFCLACPQDGDPSAPFLVWSESEECLRLLGPAQDFASSCREKTLREVLNRAFRALKPLLGLAEEEDDAFEDDDDLPPEFEDKEAGASRVRVEGGDCIVTTSPPRGMCFAPRVAEPDLSRFPFLRARATQAQAVRMDLGDLSAPEVLASPLVVQLVTWVAQFAIVFGGIVPYVPQYRQIRRTQNSEGFSSHVCLVLLLANILRVLFWFGRQFESALLLQSFVMIVAMLLMLQLCTAVQGSLDLTTKRHYFSGPAAARGHSDWVSLPPCVSPPSPHADLDLRYFWQWSRFLDYLQFVAAFSLLAAGATFALLDLAAYVEALGFLATFSEAMLGTPQLYRNYRNRSTEGMSVVMVLMWTSGDTFKTVYFLAREAPPQFWVCGLMQVFVDMAILGQVFHYGRLPRHTSAHAASAGTGKAL